MQLGTSGQISVALFYPLLGAAFFTCLSVWLSSRFATKNAERQNDLSAKLKLAEFRQAWINDLRNCFSEFQSRAITFSSDALELRELQRIAMKIRLFMNRKDRNYGKLDELIHHLLSDANQESKLQIVQEMIPLCQDILKVEWEALKSDLHYNMPVGGLTGQTGGTTNAEI
jgi:hypothetical protein